MKKRRVGSKEKFSNNRLLYSLIAFGILLIAVGGVYAASGATGAIPNPGHSIDQIQACGTSGYIIKTDSTGNGWSCVPGVSLDSSGKLDVPSNSGNGGYISSGDYGGTGSAAWFPSGIYAGGANSWIYGTVTFAGGKSYADTSGNFYAQGFYYSSDRNLKKNIQPLSGFQSLLNLERLQGVSFDWKSNGQPDLGLVAQDVQKVYPELVSNNGVNGTLAVNYAGFIAPLIETVKLQQREIENLQQQIDELKK